MTFGESVFPAGFNQKAAKEHLFIKGNHRIPPHNQRGKTLEDSWRYSTKVEAMSLTCVGCLALMGPTCQPPCYVGSPPP
jgi:hypothetical protein